MQNLYTISATCESREDDLTEGERFSVIYHNLFDYPLSFSEMIKWRAGEISKVPNSKLRVLYKNNFYFVEGKGGIVYKRILRKRISIKKLEIAKKASKVLSVLPSIKMIAVTGSLAMENSTDESDIDLLIVTKRGTLWTTRIFTYIVIHTFGFSTRKPNDRRQKDKLCLNMWLDESDLVWPKKDRNVYTAHEIGQIMPLINNDSTYEKFLFKNKWILDFWPNSVRISSTHQVAGSKQKSTLLATFYFLQSVIEKLAYKLQYFYMKPKMTREVATATRAFFHPQDWGRVVLSRLSS